MVALALIAMALVAAAPQESRAVSDTPRVFVTDSESWQIVGGFSAANGVATGAVKGGARPQTVEIVKTFAERCPG